MIKVKNYNIAAKGERTLLATFAKPSWWFCKQFYLSFGREDEKLLRSMFTILKSINVQCALDERIQPAIVLTYASNQFPRYEFEETDSKIMLYKVDKKAYYTI